MGHLSDLKQKLTNITSCTSKRNTNTISQNGPLGLEDDEVLDFAKSTRSLKRASSGFSCLVGVDGFRERFWVCFNKLSFEELDPLLGWYTPCSKNCCLWLYLEGGGGMMPGDGVSRGAGGRLSEDLLMGEGSSYTGCVLKIGDEEVFMAWGGDEENSVAVADEATLELEWRGGSEFSWAPSVLYASPLR